MSDQQPEPVVDSELRDRLAKAYEQFDPHNDDDIYQRGADAFMAVVAPALRQAYLNGQQLAEERTHVMIKALERNNAEIAATNKEVAAERDKALAEVDRLGHTAADLAAMVDRLRAKIAQALNLPLSHNLNQLLDDLSQLGDGLVRMARENGQLRRDQKLLRWLHAEATWRVDGMGAVIAKLACWHKELTWLHAEAVWKTKEERQRRMNAAEEADNALGDVDALEGENAQLRAELDALKASAADLVARWERDARPNMDMRGRGQSMLECARQLWLLIGRPHIDALPTEPLNTSAVSDEVLTDLLSLVCVTVSPERIAEWTPEQREEAANWAGATHLYASDNHVTVPPRPAFLVDQPDTEATKQALRWKCGECKATNAPDAKTCEICLSARGPVVMSERGPVIDITSAEPAPTEPRERITYVDHEDVTHVWDWDTVRWVTETPDAQPRDAHSDDA